ncbi:MAG: L,D-transpeptidase family protein [Acidobacteriota bacterium]
MKLLLTICMTAVLAPAISFAQRTNARVTRAEIRNAEQHLSDAGFWTGPIDGVFDADSRSALIAFQKWHGRDVNGQLTIDELDVIRTSSRPGARELGYEHVEVDLDRQVLMLVADNGSVRVLPTSTGNGKTFMDDGQQSISYTPRGRFLVYDKSVGWETGPLGSVFYPNYISGGVAIHGSRNVPNQPASHGCIRIPMFAAREVSRVLKRGTIVLVYDQISFVSAKDWVKNPKLKEAAFLSTAFIYDAEPVDNSKSKSRSVAIRKTRPRVVRV